MGRTERVGFAGLGAMGFGMATNMTKKGINLIGFDLNPTTLERFESHGGKATASLREASEECSKFFVMVATPAQVDSLVFGLNGESLAKSLPQYATLGLFSTLPPDYCTSLQQRLNVEGRQDIELIDAPVSGGAVGAQNGTLSIMLAGSDNAIHEIQRELEAISAPGRLFRCGELGAASMVKMDVPELNQHLAGIHVVAAAEMLAFAKACNLSPHQSYDIVKRSEASSWIFGDRGASMIEANWTPKSAVTIFTKDMLIVNESADTVSCPCPIASTAYQAFQERALLGFGGDDDASVVCNYELLIGKQVCNESSLIKPPLTLPHLDALETPICKDYIMLGEPLLTSNNVMRSTEEQLQMLESPDFCMGNPILFIWNYGTNDTMEMQLQHLSVLPSTSIVAIAGLEMVDTVTETIHQLAAKFPALHFTDCQFTPCIDDNSKVQMLISDEGADLASCISPALPCSIIARSVAGELGSATSMYLTMRLGSLIHLAAAAECFCLAQAKGVSAELLYQLIAGAAGSSHQFNVNFPKILRGEFKVNRSSSELCLHDAVRDLMQLKKACKALNFPGRLIQAVHQIFKSVYRNTQADGASIASVVHFWDTNGGLPISVG